MFPALIRLYGFPFFSVYLVSLAPPREGLSPGRSKSLMTAAPCGKIRNCQPGGPPCVTCPMDRTSDGMPSQQTHPAGSSILKTSPRSGGAFFSGANQGYGNPWFSVQAGACTEIISFPYTRSDLDPSGPRISLNHPQTAGIRKTVPFRIARHGR